MEINKLVLLTIIQVTICCLPISQCMEDERKWKHHVKGTLDFPCRQPQPRSLRFDEIIDKEEMPGVHSEVFPKMTVLHRCDSQSGCCKNPYKTCAPQVIEDVWLTFRIFEGFNKRDTNTKVTDRYFHVLATNHTHCNCQSPLELPK